MSNDTGKIYVRLKDKSTSFYDSEQDVSIVADRIGRVKPTALIAQAIMNGQLVELAEEEARPAYAKQQKALVAAGILQRKVKEGADTEEESTSDGDAGEGTENATLTKKSVGPKK